MKSKDYQDLDHAVRSYLAYCFLRKTAPRVGELASLVGMSRTAFCRHFQRVCGELPSVVLKRGCLIHARRLLASGKTVDETAQEAGFGTGRSIYRSFHAAFGLSPKASLRQNRM